MEPEFDFQPVPEMMLMLVCQCSHFKNHQIGNQVLYSLSLFFSAYLCLKIARNSQIRNQASYIYIVFLQTSSSLSSYTSKSPSVLLLRNIIISLINYYSTQLLLQQFCGWHSETFLILFPVLLVQTRILFIISRPKSMYNRNKQTKQYSLGNNDRVLS